MTQEVDLTITQNDTLPPLEAELRQADDTPIDLTDAASVKIQIRERFGPLITDAECEIVNQEAGQIRYWWETSDVIHPGTFEMVFIIQTNNGKILTVPNEAPLTLMIIPCLAGV